MKHIVIRSKANKELQAIAAVTLLYLCYAGLTGDIYKVQYLESRSVSLVNDPNEFWAVTYIYFSMSIVMLIYSFVGFPYLENYFNKAQEKQEQELASRTIKQQLFVYVVVPIVAFITIMGIVSYVNR